jgi:AraC-like DNA-binding protein
VTALHPRPQSPQQQPTRVWRSPSLPGVELTLGVNAGRRCRLLHESYAVCIVPRTGNQPTVLTRWRYRGATYEYRPGDISIEEPGEVHTCMRVHSPIRYCMLRLAPALVEDAAADLGLTNVHFPTALIGNPRLYDVISRFYRSLSQPSTLLEKQTRLAAVLKHLLLESGEPPSEDRLASRGAIERARRHLEDNLAETVGLDELSRVAGLSRFHLSRTFARAYGLSPHAYQNQLRLRAIREQLRVGSRPDSTDTGFFDQSHMIRHFRDSMGMTPGEFATPVATLPPLDWQPGSPGTSVRSVDPA